MERLENYFSAWVLQYRAWIIAVTLIVLVVAGNGLRYLGFDTDYRVFFAADNPELLAYDAVEKTYTKFDNVFILLAPKNGDIFQHDVLKLTEEITTDAWQIPYSRRVDSLQNFQHTYAEDDDLIVESLYEESTTLQANDIEKIKQIGLSDPLLVKRLVSADGRVTALNITIEFPKVSPDAELRDVVAKTREMVALYQEKYPTIDIYTTGISLLNNAFVEAGENDLAFLAPISLLLMFIITLVLLRSVSAVVGITLVVTTTTIFINKNFNGVLIVVFVRAGIDHIVDYLKQYIKVVFIPNYLIAATIVLLAIGLS